MAGLFSMFGGNRAQGPGAGSQPQPRQGGGFGTLLDPSVALPMAAQLMGNQGNMQNFAGALGAAGPALQQHQDARKQMAQRNATLEFLRQQSPEMAQAVESGMPVGDAWKTYLEQRKAQGPTDTMRNLEWRAKQAGLEPGTQDYAKFMSSGGKEGMNITIGDGAPGLNKLSTDYGYLTDPDTRQPIIDPTTKLPIAAPVPGSPAAQEVNKARKSQDTAMQAYEQKYDLVDQSINEVLGETSGWTAGPGGAILSKIPGTDAYDMSATLATIKANLGFEELQNMRDSSPTGGALGQVTERELAFLQAAQGNLDQAQTPDQLKKVLQDIQQRRAEFREARRRAYEIDYGVPMPEPAAGGDDIPLDELLDMYGG